MKVAVTTWAGEDVLEGLVHESTNERDSRDETGKYGSGLSGRLEDVNQPDDDGGCGGGGGGEGRPSPLGLVLASVGRYLYRISCSF